MRIDWRPRQDIVITVEDPGHGCLVTELLPSTDGPGSLPQRLQGHAIGQMLSSLTALALSDDAEALAEVPGLWWITVDDARLLLPVVQHAVLHAVAGPGRADRTLADPPGGEPWPPLCARCGQGSPSGATSAAADARCVRSGHVPFGEPPIPGSWERATREHAGRRSAAPIIAPGLLPAPRVD